MASTDIPICGWGDADGSLCRHPRDETAPNPKRCTAHNQPQFTVCTGCSEVPERTCGPNCHLSMCGKCHHHPDGTHSREEPGPFSTQRTADPVNKVRAQMIHVVTETLEACALRGLCSFPSEEHPARVAGVIVDQQATKALLTLQEGLAIAQASQGAVAT